jgi:hypothetical protein
MADLWRLVSALALATLVFSSPGVQAKGGSSSSSRSSSSGSRSSSSVGTSKSSSSNKVTARTYPTYAGSYGAGRATRIATVVVIGSLLVVGGIS